MNNEPVAWARQDGVIDFHKQKEMDSQGYKWFPLYTHPVKELTDEEIEEVWYALEMDSNLFEFARAILRKAKEADKIESLGTVNIGGVHYRNGKEVK